MKLEKQIEEFADLCNETAGGSFIISRSSKDRQWKVTFPNTFTASKCTQFANSDLKLAIQMAKSWLIENRKEVVPKTTKYTLWN